MSKNPFGSPPCPKTSRVWQRTLFKTLLVMKFTIVLLTAAFVTVHATGTAQTVTLSGKDMTLDQVIRSVKKQTGYVAIYNEKQVDGGAKVSVAFTNSPLTDVLNYIGDQLLLDHTIQGKTIFLSKRKKEIQDEVTDLNGSATAPPKARPITGRVTNAEGQPLEGASIRIKGTNKGVFSDLQGRFTIDGDKGQVIVVTYTGYLAKEFTISDASSITLVMTRAENKLDEVQVIAYGTTSRRLSTGNTTTVKGADIEKQPVGNSLIAIQGRVPGLFIEQGSGAPGASMKIRIQGSNSLRGGGEPFYVVDGVPYTASLLATTSNTAIWGGAVPTVGGQSSTLNVEGQGSPLSYLNPSDIESIEILKDADATAIYGSKAANGAILITTKRGKAGAVAVDIGVTSGWEDMPRRLKLLNSQQYLEMRHEAIRNSNATISPADYDLNGTWDTTRYTDWQDVFMGKASSYTNARVQVSGGSATANYLVGVTYNTRKGMLSGDFSDDKVSAHFSLNTASANQKFKMQFTGNYLVDNNRLPSVNITSSMLYLPPVAPALKNADGSLNWAESSVTGATTWPGSSHLLARLLNKFNTDVNNFISNLVLGYNFMPGLEFKTSVGYTYMQSDQLNTYPLSALQPASRPYYPRSSSFIFNNMKSYIVEPQFLYNRTIGRGKLDVLIGGTIQKSINSGRGVNAQGQVSDAQLENISAAKTLTAVQDLYNVYRYAALFSRISYNYSNKYLLNATVRRDGSSRFGPENRFHSFGAVGAAWILSEESFLKLPRVISFLKAKLSYGTTGNDQIGDYSYMNLYTPYYVDVSYGGANSLFVTGLSNNELQWEETRKLNTGVDIGLFSDRLLLGVNYAINKSSNLLQSFILPTTAGYSDVLRNFTGTVQNTSLELSLNATAIKNKAFSWNMGLNFTVGRNKLIRLPDANKIDRLSAYGYVIGKPIGTTYRYKYAGVDPQTGLYVVENANGTLTSTPTAADLKVLLNTERPYYAGFNNSISYKGIQLDFFVQFVKQIAPRYMQADNFRPGRLGNQPVSVMDRWQKPGDAAGMAKFATAGQNDIIRNSDGFYEDASFARLKNLSLSWALPDQYLKKIKMKNARLSVSMQNLFTISKYSGLDPETGISAIQPFRTIVAGVQIGF